MYGIFPSCDILFITHLFMQIVIRENNFHRIVNIGILDNQNIDQDIQL